jgi:hypothetical protein
VDAAVTDFSVPLGQVCVLHSVVPQKEQEVAMLPAMDGHCKIILSTNIAESSVTIPDVCLVINSGLQRFYTRPVVKVGESWAAWGGDEEFEDMDWIFYVFSI